MPYNSSQKWDRGASSIRQLREVLVTLALAAAAPAPQEGLAFGCSPRSACGSPLCRSAALPLPLLARGLCAATSRKPRILVCEYMVKPICTHVR